MTRQLWIGLASIAICAGCRDPLPIEPDAGQELQPDAAAPVGDGVSRFLLSGTIVTPDESFVGQVLVEADRITCVEAGQACAGRPHASEASAIDTQGVIAPGLIDTHNHILFDIFDGSDWLPMRPYTNHNQWPNEVRYGAMLDVKQCLEDASQGKPSWCPAKYDSTGNLKCEMDKWGELKALVAGTTAVVGLPGVSGECFSSLARSIDVAQNGLDVDRVRTSATFPPSKPTADSLCAAFGAGTTKSFLVHVGEGTDATALREWDWLGTASTNPGCLYAPQTVITHGTAFTAAQFAIMAQQQMKLTWSPASNVALYGATTDIPAALSAGVMVTIGPDWSMGGSQNMLDELRFANAWDDAHWNNRLSPKDLLLMATKNAALALGYDDQIGALKPGYLADLFVVSGDGGAPYDAILAATPREVRLAMVGGKVLYGDTALEMASRTELDCETLDVCGASKFICAAQTQSFAKLGQTFAEIKGALEAALVEIDAATPADGFSFAPLTPLVSCP